MATGTQTGRAATFVIAAAGSVYEKQADYTCDGVADNVEIQAAINALPADGGRVVLLEGTFDIQGTITLVNGVHISGQGAATILRIHDATNLTNIGGKYPVFAANARSDIMFSDFTIDGNKATQAVAHFGIYVYGAFSNMVAERLIIKNVRHTGISVETGNYVRVDTCYIEENGTGEGGGAPFAGNGIIVDAARSIVTHNICIKNHGFDIYVRNRDESVIADNVCIADRDVNYGEYGIGNSEYQSRRIIISNNFCYGHYSGGIVTGGPTSIAHEAVITGNIVYMSQGAGFTGLHGTSRDTWVGNLAYNNDDHGFIIGGGGTDFVFVGNLLIGNRCGLRVDGVTNRGTISGNVCNLNDRDGIYLNNTSYFNVVGNQCMNNSQETAQNWSGITLLGLCLYNTISGNICSDDQGGGNTQRHGISEGGTSNYNVIKNNVCLGNRLWGVNMIGAQTVLDRMERIHISFDLSGGATDLELYHAVSPSILGGYVILYTEASSADAGVNVRVGRYGDGVALDDDYFDISVSEVSMNKGYSKAFASADLTQKVIAAGYTVTVGTAGGKVGIGAVMIILKIAEMAN